MTKSTLTNNLSSVKVLQPVATVWWLCFDICL